MCGNWTWPMRNYEEDLDGRAIWPVAAPHARAPALRGACRRRAFVSLFRPPLRPPGAAAESDFHGCARAMASASKSARTSVFELMGGFGRGTAHRA